MKTRLVRWTSMLMLVIVIVFASGCYGSFQLIQKVHKFNGTLGNKFVNELGFLVMNIVPVYSVAGFIDVVVLNSIEFWSGKNPATSSNDTVVPLDDRTTLTLRGADGTMLLTSKTEEGVAQYVFEKTTDGTVVKNLQGKTLARCAMTPEGGMKIYDGSGNFIAECSAAQAQTLADAHSSVR
jgi:hypothetical protein